MSRPSTSFLRQQSQDVDHRDKPGDDAVVVAGYSPSWLGEATKQSIFDLAMPSHGLRAGLYPCRICGVETSEARSQVAHRERSETMCRVGARPRERILTSPPPRPPLRCGYPCPLKGEG